MREILFRGKRCDNGELVQGFYVRADHHWHNHGIHKDWIICGASANGGWFALHNKYAVKAETVGQYTGLTDKNGKKIFEGDIVRCIRTMCDEKEMVGHIVYDDCCFSVKENKTPHQPAMDLCDDFEVIGNIHDNPELIGGMGNA